MKVKVLQKKNARTIDMLHGNLRRDIVRFSMPVALTGILEQLSNLIDTMMIGRLTGDQGTLGMAAVGANTPIASLMISLFVGIALGANVTIATALGRKDYASVSRAVHTSILMSFIGVIVMVIGEIVAEPLLVLLQVPPEALHESVLFLRVYLLAMPIMLLYDFEAAIFRSAGMTKLPLQALIISTFVNVIFGFLFIGTFQWFVIGSALATVLSYVSSAVILWVRLRQIDSPIRLNLNELHWDAQSARSILRIGLPTGVQNGVFAIANILIQSAINTLGMTVMAASSAAMSIEGVVYNLLNSYSQACTTFVGQNNGAYNMPRCRSILRTSTIEVFITAAILIICVDLFGGYMIEIFNGDPEVISVGYERLRMVVTAYVFSALYEVISGYLRGFGISVSPAVITMVVICGIRFYWIFFVFAADPTFFTVMVVYPISLGVNAIFMLILLLVVRPSKRNIHIVSR